jgi:ABC-type transport system substrate-binding protein
MTKRFFHRAAIGAVVLAIGLVMAAAVAHAATPVPPPPAKAKLERLRIAVAPLGWDTNLTWLQSRSGMLDKRPALEYLVGIDRHTGAYIPELAEQWEMSPDAKTWTIRLRRGVKFHENWGEFTAKDVRHAVSLIAQPESIQTDAGLWRSLMGIEKAETIEGVAKAVAERVEIVDDYTVVFHLTSAAPEFVESISANTDLVMESKARWDAGGKSCMDRRWWAGVPLSSWSGRWARTSSISVWRITGGRPLNIKN